VIRPDLFSDSETLLLYPCVDSQEGRDPGGCLHALNTPLRGAIRITLSVASLLQYSQMATANGGGEMAPKVQVKMFGWEPSMGARRDGGDSRGEHRDWEGVAQPFGSDTQG
jgi:hypothetical protein